MTSFINSLINKILITNNNGNKTIIEIIYDTSNICNTLYINNKYINYILKEKIYNLENDIKCIICYDEIKKYDKIRVLNNCEHKYHKKCIDKWLKKKNICPICRKNII